MHLNGLKKEVGYKCSHFITENGLNYTPFIIDLRNLPKIINFKKFYPLSPCFLVSIAVFMTIIFLDPPKKLKFMPFSGDISEIYLKITKNVQTESY